MREAMCIGALLGLIAARFYIRWGGLHPEHQGFQPWISSNWTRRSWDWLPWAFAVGGVVLPLLVVARAVIRSV